MLRINRLYLQVLAGLLLIFLAACDGSRQETDPWPEPSNENKPWARWWWHGSQVDAENIPILMEQYAAAGFGGMEIAPIYGVRGNEDAYLDFLSEPWMEMLRLSSREAARHRMGLDMTLGSGWPFGGPHIGPEHAAGKLILERYTLSGGQKLEAPVMPSRDRDHVEGLLLEALVARSRDGRMVDLAGRVDRDGVLDWTAPAGTWVLHAAFCGRTGQKVKRAAPGGAGFSMDHFSPAAFGAYLEPFEQAFSGKENIRAFFNDSYEVYGASWTPGLFDEFLARRGYDLRHHLDLLAGEGDPEEVARVKSDYRETLSELLLENFTRPWTSWSNARGTLTRNQAHGSPGNLIDLYAAVDIPECEIFGHREFDIPGLPRNSDDTRNVEPNPMMLKLATSAAHVSGKKLVSNETFTWLGEHFKIALSQCKPEVEEAFLAGINHVFYHGITYSPQDADWPGWLFYASTHFGPTSTSWDHLAAMNQYITRCQSMLQAGTADNEILVYWPVFDIWHTPDGLELQLTVHNIMEWLKYPGIESMAANGYSYDFISDDLLEQCQASGSEIISEAGKTNYRVLVVPGCQRMPLATLDKILALAREGATVIFESLPADVQGYHQYEDRRQELDTTLAGIKLEDAGQDILKGEFGSGRVLVGSDLVKTLEYTGVDRERIGDSGLKFTRRKTGDGSIYFLVNHSASRVDKMLPLNTPASSVLLMDPQDGSYGLAAMETGGLRTRARVQLLPGESVFLRTYDSTHYAADPWPYESEFGESLILDGKWTLDFLKGGPQLPERLELDGPVAWTGLGMDELDNFSGTAAYRKTFRVEALRADRYILDLGGLHGSARILLNGMELGHVWSVPARIPLDDALQTGENELVIEVANLMANRIRYMDRNSIPWKIFHDINIVDISYRPFDASGWETEPSGLDGPVRIIPARLTPKP